METRTRGDCARSSSGTQRAASLWGSRMYLHSALGERPKEEVTLEWKSVWTGERKKRAQFEAGEDQWSRRGSSSSRQSLASERNSKEK